jgi:hypothetical protein
VARAARGRSRRPEGLRVARGYPSQPDAGCVAALHYLGEVALNLLVHPAVTASSTATTVTITVRSGVLWLMSFGRLAIGRAPSARVSDSSR